MVVKVREKFQKNRQVKGNDKSRKFFFTRTKKCEIS